MNNIKLFCRFLKENNIYYRFKNNCSDFNTIKYRYKKQSFIRDIITNEIHWNKTVEGLSFWSEMHRKWIDYLYN